MEACAEARAESLAEALAESRAEALAESLAEARAESRAEALAEARAEARAESRAEALAEARAESLAEALAEARAEALAESRAEALAESRAEARSFGVDSFLYSISAFIPKHLSVNFICLSTSTCFKSALGLNQETSFKWSIKSLTLFCTFLGSNLPLSSLNSIIVLNLFK